MFTIYFAFKMLLIIPYLIIYEILIERHEANLDNHEGADRDL